MNTTYSCKKGHERERAKHNGKQWICLDCCKDRDRLYRSKYPERARNSSRKNKYRVMYGITIEEYDNMVERQQGKCTICGEIPNDHHGLEIEHNHKTNEIRGLTCHPCNITIGMSKESIFRLQKCIEYLEKHNEK